MNQEPRSVDDELLTLKVDVAVIRSNYATKSDWQELRLEQKANSQELRLEHKSGYHDLRLQIEKLRVEMHTALRAQTLKLIGVGISLVAASHIATRFGY